MHWNGKISKPAQVYLDFRFFLPLVLLRIVRVILAQNFNV